MTVNNSRAPRQCARGQQSGDVGDPKLSFRITCLLSVLAFACCTGANAQTNRLQTSQSVVDANRSSLVVNTRPGRTSVTIYRLGAFEHGGGMGESKIFCGAIDVTPLSGIPLPAEGSRVIKFETADQVWCISPDGPAVVGVAEIFP
jgi:hypothetical protein